MKNRKAMMIGTIIGIIIGIVILIFVLSTFYECTRTSDDTLYSFNAFNDRIEYVAKQEKGFIEAITLQMDEYTGLYGWARDAGEIKVYANGQISSIVRRFGTCENRKEACVCLCRKFAESNFTEGVKYISCKQTLCHVFENSTFPTDVAAEGKFIVSRNPTISHKVEGGFALERHGFGLAYDVMEPRLRSGTIELEKGQGETVGVCISLPCLS